MNQSNVFIIFKNIIYVYGKASYRERNQSNTCWLLRVTTLGNVGGNYCAPHTMFLRVIEIENSVWHRIRLTESPLSQERGLRCEVEIYLNIVF